MRKVFFILPCVFASQLAMLAHGEETEAPDTSVVSEATTDIVASSDAPVNPGNVEEPDAPAATETPDAPATSQASTEAVTDAATPSDKAPADPATVEGPDGTEGTPLSSAATTIKAKDIPVDDMAFKEILTTAYTSSPGLGIAEYQIKSANEDMLEAKAGWGPKLSVSTGYDIEFDHNVYENDRPSGAGVHPLAPAYRQYTHAGKTSARADLTQNLYAGGATVASIEASKNQALGAQANYSKTQQGTLLKAAKSHLELAKNKAIQELHASNVSVLGKRLEVAKARFEFGDLTIADVATTEAELDKARSDLKAATAEVEVAKATYRKEVGKDAGPDLSIPTVPKFLPNSREEVIQKALENNPTLKKMDADIAVSQAKLDMSYAGLKPQVNLRAGASRVLSTSWNGNADRGSFRGRQNAFTAGAEVKMELDVMGVNQSKIRKAKYESALQRINGIYQRQDVLSKAVEAWEKYKALESRITELQSQVKATKIAVDTLTEGYLVGNNTTLEVLTAEQKYFSAQVELTRVKLDFLYSSFALAEATGSLTPENLTLNVSTFDGQQHYENMSMWGLNVDHDQTEYSGEHLLDLP